MSTTVEALIKLGVDSTAAKRGADDVEHSMGRVGQSAKRAQTDMSGLQAEMSGAERAGSALGAALRTIFLAVGSAAVGRFVYGTLTDLQDAMVEVANTTGKAAEDLRNLEDRLIGLSSRIPASVQSLAALVAEGHKLGIVGNKDLVEFAEAMERIGAVTDLKGPSAAKSMAQLLRAAGEEFNPAAMLRIGAAVDALSSASGAGGQELVSTARSIVLLSEKFDVGSREALAMAAALNKFGVESGSASQLVQKLFAAMDKEFLAKFGGDRIAAFEGLVGALRKASDNGRDVQQVLSSIGVEAGGRTARAVTALIKGSDELSRMLRIVRDEQANLENTFESSNRAFDRTSTSVHHLWDAVKNYTMLLGRDLTPAIGAAAHLLNDFASTLYIGADGAAELTARGKALAVVLAILATGAALVLGAPLAAWMIGAAKSAIAAASSLSGVLIPALTLLGGVLASILAFDFGGYLYDEFKIVRTTAAATISFFQEGWAYVKFGFFAAFGAIQNFAGLTLANITTKVSTFASDTATALEQLNLLPTSVADAVRAYANVTQVITGLAVEAYVDPVAEARKQLDSELDLISKSYQASIEDIEKEFEGRDRKTGKSWFERFGEGGKASIDALLDMTKGATERVTADVAKAEEAVQDMIEPIVQKVPDATKAVTDLADRFARLKDKTVEAEDGTARYREQLREMMLALRIERDLLGSTNDERERAEASARFATVANKAYGVEVAKNNLLIATLSGNLFEVVMREEQLRKAMASSKSAVSEYTLELERLQRARAAQNMSDMQRQLATEAAAFGKSQAFRQNAREITEYARQALIAYNGDADKAAEATTKFITQVERLSELEKLQRLADNIGDAFGSTFESMIFDAKSFEDAIEEMTKNVARMIFQTMVTQQIAGFFSQLTGSFFGLPGAAGGSSGGFMKFRARGGSVEAGNEYVVGEEGPEILRLGMNGSGYVIPNDVAFRQSRTGGARGGDSGGNTTVYMTVRTHDGSSFRRSERQIARSLTGAIRRFR